MGQALEAEWANHLKAWRQSGKTATEYCEERGLKFGALRYWAGRIRPEKPKRRQRSEVRFAAVQRMPATSTLVASPEGLWSGLRLRVGEADVELCRGFDEETLSRVLGVLSSWGAKR